MKCEFCLDEAEVRIVSRTGQTFCVCVSCCEAFGAGQDNPDAYTELIGQDEDDTGNIILTEVEYAFPSSCFVSPTENPYATGTSTAHE